MPSAAQPEPAIVLYPPVEIDFDRVTEPFWTLLRQGKLSVMRCAQCSTSRMPPNLYCPNCRSTEGEWPILSGRATLYSYTVVPFKPKERDNEVFVAALVCPVELPDTKLFASIAGCGLGDLEIGMELELAPPEPGIDRILFLPAQSRTEGGN